jgi:hypothetical protein
VPALWRESDARSRAVWPEYNLHGEVNRYWTRMRFPDDGLCTFPAGLAPVEIDHRRDLGAYWEPNVWIVHDLGARTRQG